jgi:hypothetical protein
MSKSAVTMCLIKSPPIPVKRNEDVGAVTTLQFLPAIDEKVAIRFGRRLRPTYLLDGRGPTADHVPMGAARSGVHT